MASKQNSVKTAYDMDPEIKFKLSMLKAELRRKGLPATEVGIIECLIRRVKPESLARAYREDLSNT